MLKTLKGKVVAGVAAVLLLVGGTAALGASNAGEKFQEWYNKLFNQHAEMVQNGYEDYGNKKLPELREEYNGIKEDAASTIIDKGKSDTAVTSRIINNQLGEHIDGIKGKHEEINKYMDEQFGELVSSATKEINDAGDAALAYALDDIGKHTASVGAEALETLNKELTDTTNQALSDIEDAINAAKQDIVFHIGQKTTKTTTEIKGIIDSKINELRGAITSDMKKLVAEQTKIITMTAKNRQLAAERAMQALVDSINN